MTNCMNIMRVKTATVTTELPQSRRDTHTHKKSHCYLSKEVDFQTKSTTKLWVHSEGTPALLFSSMATSSL